jgi:predicted transposase YdaD
MEPQIEKFFTEAHRRSYDRGEAKGEARGEARGEANGEAKALMMILQRRGLAMTGEQQHQIATCTDLSTLDRWLDRVLSVASVDELLT